MPASRSGLRRRPDRRRPASHPDRRINQTRACPLSPGTRHELAQQHPAAGRQLQRGHVVPLDPGRAASPAGRPATVDIAGAAPVEPMETTKPVDHATSPTSGTGAWRGRVRVPTVRNRRMQRGGRLQGRPAGPGQTGTAAPLEVVPGRHPGAGRSDRTAPTPPSGAVRPAASTARRPRRAKAGQAGRVGSVPCTRMLSTARTARPRSPR